MGWVGSGNTKRTHGQLCTADKRHNVFVCSCERHEVSSLRLAALRRRAARFTGTRDERRLDGGPLATSAFDIYCTCTKRRRDSLTSANAGSSYPPVAAADLVFTRWRYWLSVFYRQFFQDLENSSKWTNLYRYRRRQQQQQPQKIGLYVSGQRRRPVVGISAGVSTRSAHHFACHSCAYSTDRRNNLKRHVTTMHRRRPEVTSPGRYHDDGKVRGNTASHVINQERHTSARCADHSRSHQLRHLLTSHNTSLSR